MKKIKSCFIMITMMVFGFFVFMNNVADAAIENFEVEGVTTSTLEESYIDEFGKKHFYFEDYTIGEEPVIKSTNEYEENSVSELTITFSGVGEVSFEYLVSSETGWDEFLVFINDDSNPVVNESGLEGWKTFRWYNGDGGETVTIRVQYSKDVSNYDNDDCCYLKNLSFDQTEYSPLLQVSIDGKNYTNDFSDFVYFIYNSNDGVVAFSSDVYDINDYAISVKLNGVNVIGNDYSYNLKTAEGYNVTKNVVTIEYDYNAGSQDYKAQTFTFYYNADLNDVITGVDFGIENDKDYPFILVERGEGESKEKVISSTNKASASSSKIDFTFSGNGQVSFDYLVSGKQDFDFIKIYVNGLLHTEVSGVMTEFSNFTYMFFGGYQANVITVEYSKNENQYVLSDENAIYLKNIQFLVFDYVDVPSVSLNGEIVNDGDTIILSGSSHSLTLGEMDENTSVEVYLGVYDGETTNILPSDENDKTGPYVLNLSEDINVVVLIFSKENHVSRNLTFYIINETIEDVFGFGNDEVEPFVQTVLNDEVVVKTNIEGKDSTTTSISYTATTSGVLTIEYMVSTEVNDYFIVSVNDEEVYLDSGIKPWQVYELVLKAGDDVVISYVKDFYGYFGDDCVYFKELSFEEKTYASIVPFLINDVAVTEDTEVVYFNWASHNSVLQFDAFSENQSVVINVNGTNVDPVEGIYGLGTNLRNNNVISITFNQVDPDGVIIYEPVTITFEYNARLIDSDVIGHNPTVYYQSKIVDNESVISLNPEFASLSNAELELKVEGKGYFKFSYKYFTYDNLSVLVCFDDDYCTHISDDEEKEVWNTIGYSFFDDGEHIVSIVVNGSYFYNEVDYLYLKGFEFYDFTTLIGRFAGDGLEDTPYDYSQVIDEMNNIGLTAFSHRFYNDTNFDSIYIMNNLTGYRYIVNGEEIALTETEKLNLSLSLIGESVVVITNDSITLTIYYANEGLNDTNINTGFGSEEKPYEIYTEAQLREISKGLQYCYILMDDIVLTSNWIPLGTETEPFSGCINGNNNSISGLVVSSQEQYAGFIGFAEGAKIYDLTLENPVVSGANFVGTLIAVGQGMEVRNVTINNVSVNVIESETNEAFVGGFVGGAIESSFDDIQISGSVTSPSNIFGYFGGMFGGIIGGTVSNSSTSVNVTGYGSIGGLSGYNAENMTRVSNVSISGNVVSNNADDYNTIGVVSPGYERIEVNNVTHAISGTYTYNMVDDVTIVNAKIYGIGLQKDGVTLNMSSGSFSADVLLHTEGEILNGVKAGINGYIIRFEMSDGSYRYYEMFDFDSYNILSNGININVNDLVSFTNNFDSLTVEEGIVVNGDEENESNAYITVTINNVADFLHLNYIINYGVPTTLGSYYTFGVYNLTISFLLDTDLDLKNVGYIGLGNSMAYPYKGLVDGGQDNHVIELEIDDETKQSVGFINYYSSGLIAPRIQNVVVRGSVKGGEYAGLVGMYSGSETISFINVVNYASYSALDSSASLLGYNDSSRKVYVENCVNYADFSHFVFLGNGNSVEYRGINKNFGEYKGTEYKSLTQIFFGTSNVHGDLSTLENYYVLDVKAPGITLNFKEVKTSFLGTTLFGESVSYTSDENGKITFKMGAEEFYKIVIYGGLLKEKQYELNTNFRGELLVPQSITLSDNNELHSNGNNNWIFKANVTYYGGTTGEFDLNVDLSDEMLMGGELIFEDVRLSHDAYIIEEVVVDLTRYTDLMIDYKNLFDEMMVATDGFKEKALEMVATLESLTNIYIEGVVSEASIAKYEEFIESNDIDEEKISEWLAKIVDTITLYSSDASVTYGEEVTLRVVISYLNGDKEEREIDFDYEFSDIILENRTVRVTSKENVIVEKGGLVVYEEKLDFVINLLNKEVKAKAENSSFAYSGETPETNIYLDLGTNKFNDTVSNLQIKYLNQSGQECNPIDVGSYAINIVNYEITNYEFYDVLDLSMDSLTITPYIVDLTWNGDSESDYNGEDKFGGISAYYYDLDNQKIDLEINEIVMINAGEYTLIPIIIDNNYAASEDTASMIHTINKLNITVSMEQDSYSISYGESVSHIKVVVTGPILEADNKGVHYNALKNDIYYDVNDNIGCGNYVLIPYLNNAEELLVNYNIEKVNGTLVVVGMDTKIVAEDITYEYKGTDFSLYNDKNFVYDMNDNLIFPGIVRYEYEKNDEIVSAAIDVGTYNVRIIFDGDGNYNPSEKTITLTITPYTISVEWDVESYEVDYDGTNKLDLIDVYYIDISGSMADVSLNIDTMVNAGTYELIVSIDNENYTIAERDLVRTFVVNKIDLKLEIEDDYVMDYHANLPYVNVKVTGLLEIDNQGVSYKIVKNETEFDKTNPLDSGLYALVPVLNNEEDILANYNIEKVNGTLTVVGVETEIRADDLSYEYSGGPLDISIDGVEVYDVNGTKVDNPIIEYTITKDDILIDEVVEVGNYTVKLLFAGNQNYGYCEKEILLVVNPKSVDIVWEGTYESDYDGEDKFSNISAYYINLDEEKIYIIVETIGMINAGEYAIIARTGDVNYIASEATKSKIYKINKIDVELSVGDYSINYGESLPSISIEITGLLNKDNAGAAYKVVRHNNEYDPENTLDSGNYSIVPVLNNEQDVLVNYNISKVNGNLVVVGIETNIVFDYFTHIYNGDSFVPDFSLVEVYDKDGNKVEEPTFTYILRSNDEVIENAQNVGTYKLEICFEGKGGFAASSKVVDLVILARNLVVQIDNVSSQYGDPLEELTYTLVEGEVFNQDSMDITLTKVEGTDIGKYEITGVNNNYNYIIEFIKGEYEITKRRITVAIDDKTSLYLEEDVELTYTVFDGSVLPGDELDVTLTRVAGTDVGIYAIRGTSTSELYDVYFIDGVYTIQSIDITGITFEDITSVYTGENIEISVNSLKLSDDSNANVEYYLADGSLATEIVNVGEYTVIARLSNKNYNTLELTAVITITQAECTLGYEETEITVEYDENGYDYRLTNTTFEDGRAANVTYMISKNQVPVDKVLDAGEYVLLVDIKDDLGNYKSKLVPLRIYVEKKLLTLEYSTDTLVYNGNEQYPEFENSNDYILTFNTSDGSVPVDAGNYIMNVSHPNTNYVITNNSIEYTIEKLEIVIGDSDIYEYNSKVIETNIEITNKIDGDDLSVVLEYYLNNHKVDQIKDAGEYLVKVVSIGGDSANNYSMDEDGFVLKVNPKKIIIRPEFNSKFYGSMDPVMTYTLSEELYNGEQISGYLTREEGENVGDYLIKVDSLVVSSNYQLIVEENYKYFHIIAKEIEIEVGETTFEYDGTEKRLEITVSEGATVEYEGDMVNVGTYTVKVVVTNNNYRLPFEYHDIVVTITKRNISNVISVERLDYVYNGQKITPNISCGEYDCVITYTKDSVETNEIIYPGIYRINVLIENETEKGEVTYKLTVNKMASHPKEVSIKTYYNRIVVEKDDTLEYSIDNGEYYSSNEFNGLRAAYKYIISVRRKETDFTAASDPIVYEVMTTNNPSAVHEMIDRLTEEVNEANMKLLKEISKEINKVNLADVDANKYGKYEGIKEKFDAIVDSYESNLGNSNKVFDFIEGKVMLFNLIVTLVAFVVLKRRINNV